MKIDSNPSLCRLTVHINIGVILAPKKENFQRCYTLINTLYVVIIIYEKYTLKFKNMLLKCFSIEILFFYRKDIEVQVVVRGDRVLVHAVIYLDEDIDGVAMSLGRGARGPLEPALRCGTSRTLHPPSRGVHRGNDRLYL